MPKLTVEGYGTFQIEQGKRMVLALEQDAGVDQLHACGGNARCTTCRVEFIEGKPPMRITPKPLPLPDAVVKAKQKLGVTVEPVTPMLAEKLGLGSEDGIHVIEVARGSVAE